MNRAIRKNMFPEHIMSDHTPYEVYTPRQTYTYQNGKFFLLSLHCFNIKPHLKKNSPEVIFPANSI